MSATSDRDRDELTKRRRELPTVSATHDELTTLTRERLIDALHCVRTASLRDCHQHPLRMVVLAAERLLAPPASDEELDATLDKGWLTAGDMTADERARAALIWRTCERRYLLPADDGDARGETSITTASVNPRSSSRAPAAPVAAT